MLESMGNGFHDIWYNEADVRSLEQKVAVADAMADYYREAYSDSARALLAAEDIGWVKLGVSQTDLTQISLTEAKDVSKRLHGYCESNPLLTRGREIRNSYLFNGDYKIATQDADNKLSPQQKNIIALQKNQDNVFSMAALEKIEGERYSAGNVFVLYDRGAKTFQQIPFTEIADIIYNPDDKAEIWYVKREWSSVVIKADGSTEPQTQAEYYPSSKYKPEGAFARIINKTKVNIGKRMVVDRVNVQPGGNLGIPDSFAAAPWALAYSAYLSDGSKVLAALAEWAWLVKPKKQNPAERAAANVRTERGVAGTLFTDFEVSALPTSNAVDLETGRPLAAQAASALGVSVVLLLADPGQSGTNATAQTLSDPNRRTMEARRKKNTEFLIHCLVLIGITKPSVLWPKMSPGTDKEEMELTMMAWGSGLFHEDEVREPLAELAHITIIHPKPPKGFILPNNLEAKKAEAEATSALKNEEIAASEVKADGSSEMSNGQGRDSLGVGNASHTQQAGGQRQSRSARANT
jgi:hypothetical protein